MSFSQTSSSSSLQHQTSSYTETTVGPVNAQTPHLLREAPAGCCIIHESGFGFTLKHTNTSQNTPERKQKTNKQNHTVLDCHLFMIKRTKILFGNLKICTAKWCHVFQYKYLIILKPRHIYWRRGTTEDMKWSCLYMNLSVICSVGLFMTLSLDAPAANVFALALLNITANTANTH